MIDQSNGPRQQYVMTTQSKDRSGIIADLTTCLAAYGGFVTALSQFGTPDNERFFSRIKFNLNDDKKSAFNAELAEICDRYNLMTKIHGAKDRMPTLLMVSKFDHCLSDLLYRVRTGSLRIDVRGIVSNHPDAKPLADAAGVPFHHIQVTKDTKPQAEAALRTVIDDTKVDLIVLARYMQILSESVCEDYSGRIINIHHSFLPSFKGAKPYHRAYEKGVKMIGATAHYVTSDLDEGPIIEQAVQRVDHRLEPNDLIAVGRDVECKALARAVRLHATHRSFIDGNKTVILD